MQKLKYQHMQVVLLILDNKSQTQTESASQQGVIWSNTLVILLPEQQQSAQPT